ncbi:hypothetical protein C4573_00900 [Candidatus Woesearchaeota archaeon]|nr:MAG: hypothetical protein C4573_00900 [Candidatus Woesearchaeota archaeon]
MADIMIIGAHPDDAEFGMGGTIAKFAEQGHSLVIVVLTRGENGTYGNPEEREKECKAAAKYIEAELELLDFHDCNIFDSYEARLKIANVVRKYKPKIVFAPYFEHKTFHKDGLSHPDHSATGLLVKNALRIAKFKKVSLEFEVHSVQRIVYYMVPRDKSPTFINDISSVIEKWEGCAKQHKSQLALAEGKVIERLKVWRRYCGELIGVQYGEGFIIEEPLIMDSEFLFKM